MRLSYPAAIKVLQVPCTGRVDIIHLLNAAREMSSTLSTLPAHSRSLSLLPSINNLCADNLDAEFKSLLKLLKSPVRNPGTLLSVYKRIFELKDKFTLALEAIGEIDAYVAMATAIRDHKHLKNGYCFPQLETSPKPHIDLENAWYPLTPANEAVPNSIELGTPKISRNAIFSPSNLQPIGVSTGHLLAQIGMDSAVGLRVLPCLDPVWPRWQ